MFAMPVHLGYVCAALPACNHTLVRSRFHVHPASASSRRNTLWVGNLDRRVTECVALCVAACLCRMFLFVRVAAQWVFFRSTCGGW